jgi:hypothetical protein
MAATILTFSIFGLFIGGALMALWSKPTAQLDARVSLWIGYRLFPKKMRKAWGRQEEFKKYLARKKTLLIYKIFGAAAILLGIYLAIFLANIS